MKSTYLIKVFLNVFIFLFSLGTISLNAQNVIEPSAVVDKGTVLLENAYVLNIASSYFLYSFYINNTLVQESHNFSGLFRIGLSNNFELLFQPSVTINKQIQSSVNKQLSIDDFSFGLKAQLLRNDKIELAILNFNSIPTASNFSSAGEFNTNNILSLGHSIKTVGIGYNIGVNYGIKSKQLNFPFSIMLSKNINDKIGLFVETFGSFSPKSPSNQQLNNNFDLGFNLFVHEKLQVDFSYGFNVKNLNRTNGSTTNFLGIVLAYLFVKD